MFLHRQKVLFSDGLDSLWRMTLEFTVLWYWYIFLRGIWLLLLMCGITELSSPVGCDFHHFGWQYFDKRRSFMVLPYHSFALSCLIKVNTIYNTKHSRHGWNDYTVSAGLAQSVESLTTEREVGVQFLGQTSTQGLKISEKWRYFLCPANG